MSADFFSSYGDDSGRLPLSSQRFDPVQFESFSDYDAESDSFMEGGVFEDFSANGGGDVVPPPLLKGDAEDGEVSNDGPVLPPTADMEVEKGFALREWRRQNAIRLEEKERREKEILKHIIQEADEYKEEYYKKWKLRCENSKSVNREKEKLIMESREKFHAEAEKNFWKAISELVPMEIPTAEKRAKTGNGRKPSILVTQGPKPGRPTDLHRMHQILVKLKLSQPGHMLPPKEPGKDALHGTTPAASALLSSGNFHQEARC